MSIATKTGDSGTTGLMYNRRVSKCHPRVEAYGCVDELNAALGVARSLTEHPSIRDQLLAIQKDLVILMGELATSSEDAARYAKDGFTQVGRKMVEPLDAWIHAIEAQKITYKGWATPGGTRGAAALDMARTVCRRSERRVAALLESGESNNREILIFLNRLADLLWLQARWDEHQAGLG